MKIQTTLAKAKEIQPVIERMITRAKGATLGKTRLIARTASPVVTKKILETANRSADRVGGYTRIVKLGRRKSDGAEMAVIELVK